MEVKKLEFIGPRVMPGGQKEMDYFCQVPEFQQRCQSGNAVVIPRRDQVADGRGSTGKLFSQTLNTADTIPHCIVMFEDTYTAQSSTQPWLPISTCSVFYQLGEGVCGFGNICHGGIQTTLLDDVMGVLGVLNARLQDGIIPSKVPGAYWPRNNPGMVDLTKSLFATQGIEVKFLRPLRTPQVIEVSAQLVDMDVSGGSFTVQCVIRDMKGKQYAVANANWVIHTPRPRSRL
uniref:Verlamelin biosynthesis protein B n=1 Tax=Lecanicillium sp. TaxID=1756136 RepID=VLMB_LECSP|nr:RecName: Full=Verlamelin biosynthesis protein B [Lecanicillium sp.]BAO73254.1 putative thioesterase [Lecanicillium sp. HF627]